MSIPNKPKGMKDPVMIVGKWEERIPKPNAGTTSTDVTKLHPSNSDNEGLAGMKFVPQVKKSE